DPALLRAGRFDLIFELPLPDENARTEIFKVHTKGKPLARDVDLKTLASLTDDMVGSDIEVICREASMTAIRKFLSAKKQDYSKFKVAMKDLKSAVNSVRERG
ncbi:MAG: AAA family ATPase, partial [Thermodesulfobacteriota bacterium]